MKLQWPGKRPNLAAISGSPAGRVMIGYPTGFSVTLPFQISLVRMMFYELSKQPNKRNLASILHASGLYVGDNRQTLTKRFMAQKDADWLLQIDTDIEFPPNLIEVLLELAGSDKKIIACSVPLGLYRTCAFKHSEKPGIWEEILAFPDGVTQVDGIATAVCLVHREVFQKIAEEYGRTWWEHMYIVKNPDAPKAEQETLMQGEDLAFSIRATSVGYKIWCAFVTKLKHYKTRALSHDELGKEKVETPGTPLDPGGSAA